MPTKKILAIRNLISGIAKKDDIPKKINSILSPEEFSVDIAYTERAGHATELAKDAVEKDIILY